MKPDTQQEEAIGQEEEKEKEEADKRRKKVLKKLEKLRWQRCFSNCRRQSSAGFDMGAVYELKLRKLKMNNRALAKALADQKVETQQWYREVVNQKGELQEAQERLLRATDNDLDYAVDCEVEKRLREHCEPINTAISTAMENVVVVVENLTNAKQLIGGILNSSQNRSSSSSLPRTSGSRLPLGPIGNSLLPRQSVVLPMVSGHVLQPAMVAIPKLDVMWSRKVKDRIQAHVEEDLDMSTIGEQPSNVEDEEGNLSPKQEESDDNGVENTSSPPDFNNTTNSLEENGSTPSARTRRSRKGASVSEVQTHVPQCITPDSTRKTSHSKRNTSRRGARGAGSRINRQSPATSSGESHKTSQHQEELIINEKNAPAAKPTGPQIEEDPLEGPSWWYIDVPTKHSPGRSRGRGRRGRGGRRGRLKTGAGSSVRQSQRLIMVESSSDSEDDNVNSVSKKTVKSATGKELEETVQSAKVTPVKESLANALDHSYLASPGTMLARLEALEEKAGRRSKARSKGRSLRVSKDGEDKTNERDLRKQRRSIRQSQETLRGPDETAGLEKTDKSFNPHLDEISVVGNTHFGNDSLHQNSRLMPPPNQQRDFLITGSDLTCVDDVSMDMTEPVTEIIVQAAAREAQKEEKFKDRRFFKTLSEEQPQVKLDVAEKTPFDVSLMDATLVNIPPYSSQRTFEKENLPPQLNNDDDDVKEVLYNSVSLRRVSVVVEDVLKSPRILEKYTPSVDVAVSSGSVKSGSGSDRVRRNKLRQGSMMDSPSKKKPIKRKTLRYTIPIKLENELEEEEEEETGDKLWTPSGVKKRRSKKRKTVSSGKAQVRKSIAGRKRSPVVDDAPQPLKRSLRIKNETDSESPTTTPKKSTNDQDGGSKDISYKARQKEKELNITSGKAIESQNTFSSIYMNKCYVKVQRTNIKDIQDSPFNVEKNLVLQLDDSRISLSPVNFISQTPIKEMERVMKKALQMRMEQSGTSETTRGVNTNVEEDEKPEKESGVKGRQTTEEEKSNTVQPFDKAGGSGQSEERDEMQQGPKDDGQSEEKDEMQHEKVEQQRGINELPQEEKDDGQNEEKDDRQNEKEESQQEKVDLHRERNGLQLEEKDEGQNEEKDELQQEKDKLKRGKNELQHEEKEELQKNKRELQQEGIYNLQKERDEMQHEEQDILEKEQVGEFQQAVPLSKEHQNHQDHQAQQNRQDDNGKHADKDCEILGEVQSEMLNTLLGEVSDDVEQQPVEDRALKKLHTEEECIKLTAETGLKGGKEKVNVVRGNSKRKSEKKVSKVKKEDSEDIGIEESATQEDKIESRKIKEESNVKNEEQQPRKRRAAAKITSFKEMGLQTKLRQGAGNTIVVSSRKSGRSSHPS